MSKKSRSKKHHYLPRNYLRGFTNEAGCFYVYDKLRDLILPKPLSPSSMFFENDLNTVTLPRGEQSDFMEQVYAEMEGRAWSPFDRIRDSTKDDAMELLDKMKLMFFLSFLYWRLPSNFERASKLSESLFTPDSELPFARIVDTNGQDAPEEIASKVRDFPEWGKLARYMASFAPFYADDWHDQLKGWRFLYSGDGANWFLVGDNPIVSRFVASDDPEQCLKEFAFPVSGNIVLVATDQDVGSVLDPEFAIQFGVAIITRSKRFAAFPRKDFLEAIVQDYRLHKRFRKESTVVERLFLMLDSR